MRPSRATAALLRSTVLALGLLVPVACSGSAQVAPNGTGGGTATEPGPATENPPEPEPNVTAPPAAASLPADPCTSLIATIKSLGWAVRKTEARSGPGGPNTQCNFEADRPDTTYETGWVAYIPAEQMPLEYHEQQAVTGLGVEAFRGSPQSGEILATGASPGFRLFVASGDKAAIEVAKGLVAGS